MYTGYLPQELNSLHQSNNLENFITKRTNELLYHITNVYNNATLIQKEDFECFLKNILLKRYGLQKKAINMKNLCNFYDKGLFFVSSDKQFQFISQSAKNAINSILSTSMLKNLKRIDSVKVFYLLNF